MNLSHVDERVLRGLHETASVAATARLLAVPERTVRRVALQAFGLDRLEVRLSDF